MPAALLATYWVDHLFHGLAANPVTHQTYGKTAEPNPLALYSLFCFPW
jgi:hypothetical protein